jgi:hypothetical protein
VVFFPLFYWKSKGIVNFAALFSMRSRWVGAHNLSQGRCPYPPPHPSQVQITGFWISILWFNICQSIQHLWHHACRPFRCNSNLYMLVYLALHHFHVIERYTILYIIKGKIFAIL